MHYLETCSSNNDRVSVYAVQHPYYIPYCTIYHTVLYTILYYIPYCTIYWSLQLSDRQEEKGSADQNTSQSKAGGKWRER